MRPVGLARPGLRPCMHQAASGLVWLRRMQHPRVYRSSARITLTLTTKHSRDMKILTTPNENSQAQSGTEVGHLIPFLSLPSSAVELKKNKEGDYAVEEGTTRSLGVVTSDGLFPIPSGLPAEVQDEALAQFRPETFGGKSEGPDGWFNQTSPVEVEVRMDKIYLNGRQIGFRSRYNGDAYDPFSPNPGDIKLVMEVGNSLRLSSRNPGNGATTTQSHGSTFRKNLVSAIQVLQDPNSPRQGDRSLVQPFLMFMDMLYGAAIDVNYETLEFGPSENDDDGRVAFLERQIERGLTGRPEEPGSSADDSGMASFF